MSVHPPVLRERVVCTVEAGRASVDKVADLFEVGRSSVLGRLRLKRETGTVNPQSASVETRATRYPAKATTIQDVDEAGRPEEVGLCGRIRCQHQGGAIAYMNAPGPRENRSPPHELATGTEERTSP